MKLRFSWPISLLLMVFSCTPKNQYPGFTYAGSGIYYKLHKIGEESMRSKPGDYITVRLAYRTLQDSLFFTGTRRLEVDTPAFPGSIDACFTRLAKGDSATFLISADKFFTRTLQTNLPRFIRPGSDMKISIGMLNVQTREDYERQKEAFLSWIDDFGEYEKVILQQYLATENLPVKPLPSGIYFLDLQPGKGKKVEQGDTVTVNYEGKFLNGKFFDSTVRRKQPFQFVYGTEWQVIKGLEDAIGIMHEGERALVIMPSELGFGEQGSSTGVIPPFTSLIFEVEILKVSSPGKI
jgi:FKBP-type peptidyl-prolyl cis-trans isomerase FkpA